MKKSKNTVKQVAAALLVFCVLAAVWGCNRNAAADADIETLVLTDANGETKVSYKVVVTATDESGEEYTVTEYYVDDRDEAVEAMSKAAKTTTSAKSANGTTAAPDIPDPTTPGATTKPGGITPGTTAKHGKTTTAAGKTSTSAAKTTAVPSTTKPATGGSTTTTKPTTTTQSTTKSTTTTKASTTVQTTAYVPVSPISASFTYLNSTDKAAYYASSNTLSDFGLPADAQNSLKKDPSKWRSFTIAVDFKNTTDSNITVYGLNLKENGKNSVYVAPNSAGIAGYAASDKSAKRIYFNVLVGNGNLEESAVIATIKSMGVSIVYSRTPGSDNDDVKMQYSDIK